MNRHGRQTPPGVIIHSVSAPWRTEPPPLGTEDFFRSSAHTGILERPGLRFCYCKVRTASLSPTVVLRMNQGTGKSPLAQRRPTRVYFKSQSRALYLNRQRPTPPWACSRDSYTPHRQSPARNRTGLELVILSHPRALFLEGNAGD